MTTLVALVLTVAALGAILTPALRRRGFSTVGAAQTTLDEWRERYRASLADLQDAELDWQIGNLSDGDYATIREEQRHRAAEALREVTLRETVTAELRAAVARHPTNGVAEHLGEASPEQEPIAGAQAALVSTASRPAGPGAVPFILGGAVAVAAITAIVVMYFRLIDAQSAQQPLATLPLDHAHAIALGAGGDLWVGHHGGVLRSADGQAWRAVSVPGDVLALPTLGNRRFALGHDMLLASDDAGATWVPVAHNLPGTDIHGADAGGAGLYAYVVGFGLFRSADGSRWEPTGPALAEEVGGLAVLPAATGGDVIYLNVGGTIARSPDGGRTWGGAGGAGNLALGGFANALAADARAGVLFAGTSQGLFRSSSGGADWTRLPFRGAVNAVDVDGQRVAIVDDRGRFFLSTDGGGTWVEPR